MQCRPVAGACRATPERGVQNEARAATPIADRDKEARRRKAEPVGGRAEHARLGGACGVDVARRVGRRADAREDCDSSRAATAQLVAQRGGRSGRVAQHQQARWPRALAVDLNHLMRSRCCS